MRPGDDPGVVSTSGRSGSSRRGCGGPGPAEAPGRLCAVAVELLPVDGASVSLRGDSMPLQLAASGAGAARLAQLQATLGDGPCHHVLRTGAPVLARDLADGACADRWPVFAQQALGSGVRAVYALPLGSTAVCVGTLDLYSASPAGSTRTSCRWPCWSLKRDDRRPDRPAVRRAGRRRGLAQRAGRRPRPGASGGRHDHGPARRGRRRGPGPAARDAFAHDRTVLEAALDVVARRRRFDTP